MWLDTRDTHNLRIFFFINAAEHLNYNDILHRNRCEIKMRRYDSNNQYNFKLIDS